MPHHSLLLRDALRRTPRASHLPTTWADLATYAAVPWGVATLLLALVAHAFALQSTHFDHVGPYFDAVIPGYLWVGAFVAIAFGPVITRMLRARDRASLHLTRHALLQHTLHALATHLPDHTRIDIAQNPHGWLLSVPDTLHISATLQPRPTLTLHLLDPVSPELRQLALTLDAHLEHRDLTLHLPRSPRRIALHLERWRALLQHTLRTTTHLTPLPAPTPRHPPRHRSLTRHALDLAPALTCLLIGLLTLRAGLDPFFPPWLLAAALPLAGGLVLWARDIERNPAPVDALSLPLSPSPLETHTPIELALANPDPPLPTRHPEA